MKSCFKNFVPQKQTLQRFFGLTGIAIIASTEQNKNIAEQHVGFANWETEQSADHNGEVQVAMNDNMFRFTSRKKNGKVQYSYSNNCFIPLKYMNPKRNKLFKKKALERLAEYEDTGMTPEEINGLINREACSEESEDSY